MDVFETWVFSFRMKHSHWFTILNYSEENKLLLKWTFSVDSYSITIGIRSLCNENYIYIYISMGIRVCFALNWTKFGIPCWADAGLSYETKPKHFDWFVFLSTNTFKRMLYSWQWKCRLVLTLADKTLPRTMEINRKLIFLLFFQWQLTKLRK